MAKKLALLVILFVISLSLISCQTVAGMGGDIKWTAEATADMLEGE